MNHISVIRKRTVSPLQIRINEATILKVSTPVRPDGGALSVYFSVGDSTTLLTVSEFAQIVGHLQDQLTLLEDFS
jgi:hypothetical protein